MSRASTFASMAQQLGISIGVACAAVTLNLSMHWRGDTVVNSTDLFWGFMVIGLITALSCLSFARLSYDAIASLQSKPQ